MTSGGPLPEALLDLALIGLPGVLILYVGRRLSSTEFDPALYPRIALWCLGGVAVMLAFIFLRQIHPGVTVNWTFGTRAIALSMGSIGGLAIGIHEARALTREREIDRQNGELKRTREALEQRNGELVRTKAELERTIREVETSNEQLERFAHAASHDMQEPLRMITNYLELLDSRYADDLDEDATEFIGFAKDGAVRMQTMVGDLLQYSQVESQSDQFETVDLDSVIADTLRDLEVRIEESDAEITVDDLPRVEGDPGQLRQLFQNLVSNAIEYAGEAPPRIRISAEDTGDELRVAVDDDGIGVPPDDRDRIFEVFQRLHSIDDHAGSGIGLALCRRIVDRHGGDIWADSEPGEGTTFTFTIAPAGEDPARAAPDVPK